MRSEKGIAMVLALSLIGLLSSLGLYLIMGSMTSYRTTSAMQRSESAFNLAEAATQLGLRCLFKSSPSPSFLELNSSTILPVQTGLDYMAPQSNLGGGTIIPNVDYIGYKITPPPGWMLNWQGNSSFYSLYLRSRGQASITLPASKGATQSTVTALVLNVTK